MPGPTGGGPTGGMPTRVVPTTKTVKIPWYRQKTSLTAILGIIGAGVGFATGTLPLLTAVQLAGNGLIAIFLRLGIEKTKQ